MANGLLQQAVAQEASGTQQASPAEQSMYEIFVKTCAILAAKLAPQMKDRMNVGAPVDSFAQIAVMIVERALDQLSKQGIEIPEEIVYKGGIEVLGILHEEIGLSMSDEEKKLAAEKAVDLFLSHQEQAGTLDTQGLAQVAEALKQGNLPLEGAT